MPSTESPSPPLLITGGTLVLPDELIEDGELLIEGGIIRAVGPRQNRERFAGRVVDVQGAFIAPGFVDIHVHGGGGADYMDGNSHAVRVANRCHARHGTTTIFPTTTTGSKQQITRMIAACHEVQHAWLPLDGARVGGVHFYGPYFAEDKVGCHSKEGRRDPDMTEYRPHFDTGLIRIATCAAELPGADEFYKMARKHGCLITCGHSNSSWGEMEAAFKLGMRHVDHFWCVMSSVASLRPRFGTPMQASMEQFVLANPEMSTEVIADGYHLSPELLRFAYQMKGADRLCLVTDASRAVDCPPGEYRFGPLEDGSLFASDGKVGRTPDGANLASSVVGLDHMLRTMHAATHAPLPHLIRMASLTPAERTGIAKTVGSLTVGKHADVVVLSPTLEVQQTFIGGEEYSPASGVE